MWLTPGTTSTFQVGETLRLTLVGRAKVFALPRQTRALPLPGHALYRERAVMSGGNHSTARDCTDRLILRSEATEPRVEA